MPSMRCPAVGKPAGVGSARMIPKIITAAARNKYCFWHLLSAEPLCVVFDINFHLFLKNIETNYIIFSRSVN
jgi:hypothetical protein